MKTTLDLELGFSDAENYKRRENKQLLSRFFIRNKYLDDLCNPAISFLIGEKGTGKTAYSVFLSNSEYKNTLSSIRYIRETDYQKFVSLKNQKHLGLSDYVSVWKVILFLLLSEQIKNEGGIDFLSRFVKLKALDSAIAEYYNCAFSPEITQAFQFVQESKMAAELIAKHAKASGEEKDSTSFTESRFQTNLFYIGKMFEDALGQVRLSKNHILFIDGIDIRPPSIPYNEYAECIKGLANAIWEMNNDFFPTMKGVGRMRVVLLVRPDIFESLGLQNQNTKIRDNSVFLDWRTTYPEHRKSGIFQVIDHLLASQQDGEDKNLASGGSWNYYFPWNAPNVEGRFSDPTSFLGFLRWSYYRPRDVITMLRILQDIAKEKLSESAYFTLADFNNPEFQARYSDYLLGEVKDHLTFYYGRDEYELFLKFFEFLNGKSQFDYADYVFAYGKFEESCLIKLPARPNFMANSGAFLQFLYESNVICFFESTLNDKPFIRWCFRERSYANILPKVKEGATYGIFYGLQKALNVGQELRKKHVIIKETAAINLDIDPMMLR